MDLKCQQQQKYHFVLKVLVFQPSPTARGQQQKVVEKINIIILFNQCNIVDKIHKLILIYYFAIIDKRNI